MKRQLSGSQTARDGACRPRLKYMRLAIEVAENSRRRGGNGVGAVVVLNGKVVACASTTLVTEVDPTSHAEIKAIRKSCRLLRTRYLKGCWLYSTFEPCPMCASAAVWEKMRGIVFGAGISDRTPRAHQRVYISAREIADHGTPRLAVCGGVLRSECLLLLR